jgi:hypothetical protein
MAKVKGVNRPPQVNVSGKKVEKLVTIEQIRQSWLFGISLTDKNTGEEMKPEALQQALDTAISFFEHYLDISVSPVKGYKEYKDYVQNEYYDWGYFQLDNFPIDCVNSIRLVYFRDDNGEVDDTQTINIPPNWIRANSHDGIIRLVPNGKFPANLQIGNGGFYPELFSVARVPHAWEVNYDYGFCDGLVPVLLNQAIGMMAAILVLIPGGNLVLGAGIAGTSLSLDGLSQSIQTTQSAENSAYSATIKDFSEKLLGKTKDDPFALVKVLRDYYKGSTMTVF